MESLKPEFTSNEFKIAASEVLNSVPLAFRDSSFFEDEILGEQDAD